MDAELLAWWALVLSVIGLLYGHIIQGTARLWVEIQIRNEIRKMGEDFKIMLDKPTEFFDRMKTDPTYKAEVDDYVAWMMNNLHHTMSKAIKGKMAAGDDKLEQLNQLAVVAEKIISLKGKADKTKEGVSGW